ncbi:glycosyltransferase family 9 protein [Thermodesulfobacteriota bacterium]
MNIQSALKEWETFGLFSLDPKTIAKDFAGTIAHFTLNDFLSGNCKEFRPIDLLARMSIYGDNDPAAEASAALYQIIIEGLCNDFSSHGIACCNKVILRILSLISKTPQGQGVEQLLNRFGYTDETLLDRYSHLQEELALPDSARKHVRKLLILSRVTIGADIVITSPMVHRLSRAFPDSELVLIGPHHLAQLFNRISNLRFHEISYHRFGDIFEKTTAWPKIHALVQQECSGCGEHEILLFDPDSRYTQLGMLPLIDLRDTYYFPSRRDLENQSNPSLSTQVNLWLDQIINDTHFCHPRVSFREEHMDQATSFMNKIPGNTTRSITINLGVGGNENKRIPSPFEEKLLLSLLENKNTFILLDSGHSPESAIHVHGLLDMVRNHGFPSDFVTEEELGDKTITFSNGVMGFRGSIGAIGALIEKSNGFFGYDSCCQHLAAAVGTPAVIAFAGAPNERFLHRWRPLSKYGTVKVFPVENSHELTQSEIRILVEKIAVSLHDSMEIHQE